MRALAQSQDRPVDGAPRQCCRDAGGTRIGGRRRAVAWLERYLASRGCGEDKVLLLLGFTGSAAQVDAMRTQARSGSCAGMAPFQPALSSARKWRASRFKSAYLRNALWSAGYAVDTMETAVDWPRVSAMMRAMEEAGRDALAKLGEKCHVQTHLSQVYPQGSSVYSTFVFRVGSRLRHGLCTLARVEKRSQRGDRARGRHDFTSARSREGSRGLLGGGKGRTRHASAGGDDRSFRPGRARSIRAILAEGSR